MSSSTISTRPAETVSSLAPIAGEQLERRLEEPLHQDRFAPPARFVATERINEASLHARAELDPEGRAGVGAIDPSPPPRAHRLMAGSNAKQGDRARARGLVARAL
jgi:hypothetical protein